MTGASTFPRHWVYDDIGPARRQVGQVIDFDEWYAEAFGPHSPWGGEESPALVAEVESSLERRRSRVASCGADRSRRSGSYPPAPWWRPRANRPTSCTWCSTECSTSKSTAPRSPRSGPGSVLGERAILEGGTRTATLRTITEVEARRRHVDQIDWPRWRTSPPRHRRVGDRRSDPGFSEIRGAVGSAGDHLAVHQMPTSRRAARPSCGRPRRTRRGSPCRRGRARRPGRRTARRRSVPPTARPTNDDCPRRRRSRLSSWRPGR